MEGGEHLNQMLGADRGAANRGGKHVRVTWASPRLGSVLEQVRREWGGGRGSSCVQKPEKQELSHGYCPENGRSGGSVEGEIRECP